MCRSAGQQPVTKSGLGPNCKQLINSPATGYRVPRFGLHENWFVHVYVGSSRTFVFCALKGENTKLFPGMLCMKRVYKDKKASVHWSAARNEERPSSRG